MEGLILGSGPGPTEGGRARAGQGPGQGRARAGQGQGRPGARAGPAFKLQV